MSCGDMRIYTEYLCLEQLLSRAQALLPLHYRHLRLLVGVVDNYPQQQQQQQRQYLPPADMVGAAAAVAIESREPPLPLV